jgi:Bifunctional DNA primase/polymerase, N-terminal
VYGQPWPDTLTVATPHDGGHLYFRIPPDTAAASTISRWPGIDMRAPGYRTGSYLADPGSVVDGAEYVPAAPLPRWLASLLTSPAPVP